ncbi:MAG: polysaccharide pyruvyl transferase CsaB [Fimbriimonadaceae bacterium]|nr:polysaccharide pyruvyl transferase CsaB [Fimbriimonadaceae bacterium]
MARLLLAGYFGCGNLGDDALLLAMIGSAKSHSFQVLTASQEMMMRKYGLPGVPRKDFGAIGQALDSCDALVFPGGSVFQDVTSTASVLYYSKLVSLAKKKGKKVVMLSQGVGPLTSFFGKRAAMGAFDAADAVAVRDPDSERTLRTLGHRGRVEVTADLAWLLPPQGRSGEAFGVAASKTIGIAPRPWGKGGAVAELFAETARGLSQRGFMPVFIEMDQESDGPLLSEIGKRLGGKAPEIKNLDSPRTVQQRMARMDAVIAMRLHAGILAALEGVPTYLVSYDPKVTALAPALGLAAPLRIDGLKSTRLVEGFASFIQDSERIAAALPKRVEALRAAAERNIEVLDRALAG